MAQTVIPEWLKENSQTTLTRGEVREGFVEKNLKAVSSFAGEVLTPARYAGREGRGLFQGISARARVGGIFVLLFGAAFMEKTASLVSLVFLSLLIGWLSRVDAVSLLKRAVTGIVFSGVVVVPVVFDFFSPGREFLGFDVFGLRLIVTWEGLGQAGFFVVRVTAMVLLVALLFLTTKETDIFRGLKGLKAPVFFTTALFMVFRYISVLLKVVEDTSLSRKSRTIDPSRARDSRQWISSRAGFIFERAMRLAEEVTTAMAARGFTGEIRVFKNEPLAGRDYLWLGFTFFVFLLSFKA